MSDFIDRVFARAGRPAWPLPGPDCPDDEALTLFLEGTLDATGTRGVEDHLLVCSPCHQVVRAVVDATAPSPSRAPEAFRVVARLVGRGLELLNGLELTLRAGPGGSPAPALGAARGPHPPAPSDLLTLEGPGAGLDLVELQCQSDGSVRLAARGELGGVLADGESAAIALSAGRQRRETRAYEGAAAFGPLAPGRHELALTARGPAGTRSLAAMTLDLLD